MTISYRLSALSLLLLAGCTSLDSVPAGAQLSSSTTGLRVAPGDPTGAPVTLGSHTTAITTAVPEGSAPNLSRHEWSLPFSRGKTTIATGEVGEQIERAGGPEALRALTTPIGPSIPLPRTDEWRKAESGERRAEHNP